MNVIVKHKDRRTRRRNSEHLSQNNDLASLKKYSFVHSNCISKLLFVRLWTGYAVLAIQHKKYGLCGLWVKERNKKLKPTGVSFLSDGWARFHNITRQLTGTFTALKDCTSQQRCADKRAVFHTAGTAEPIRGETIVLVQTKLLKQVPAVTRFSIKATVRHTVYDVTTVTFVQYNTREFLLRSLLLQML